jgi:hypothetical protein
VVVVVRIAVVVGVVQIAGAVARGRRARLVGRVLRDVPSRATAHRASAKVPTMRHRRVVVRMGVVRKVVVRGAVQVAQVFRRHG